MSSPSGQCAREQIRVTLVEEISRRVQRDFDTDAAAAAALGIGPDMMSRLMHGKYELFSIRWLIDKAEALGVEVAISVK